jgi:acyl-CoA dehydrogenase
MDFAPSAEVEELKIRVQKFFDQHILPRNEDWCREVQENGNPAPAFLNELRAMAKAEGLWNLALPQLADDEPGTRLSNLEFAPIAEILGRLPWASNVFNCHAPNVPNMEILQLFATPEQKREYLYPSLEGDVTSTFAMTEPAVASSDATNISTRIDRDGDYYVINGCKWFATNAANESCAFAIVVGITNPDAPRGRQHSIVLVPTDTPGFEVVRVLPVFGHKDIVTPHSEVLLTDVRVPVGNLLGGEGEGFLIGQSRLGPARVHHCMRAIGQCEVLLRLMIERARSREAFGNPLQNYSNVTDWIAESRLEIEQARLLVQKTAWMIDTVGNKAARKEISLIKVGVARAYENIANRAIQVFGALAVTDDGPFANALGQARSFRLYDGPDEVHLRTIFRLEEAESRGHKALSPIYLRGPGAV